MDAVNLSRELSFAVQAMAVGRGLPADVDFKAVVSLLKSNGVSLLMMARRGATRAFWSSPEFRREHAGESERYSLSRAQYRKVRQAFLAQGIEAMLFKSVDSYPSFPYNTGNLDVLIKPDFMERARAILRRLGYVELRNIEEPCKFLFKRLRDGREASAIHLHTQIGWGVPFLDNDFVWQRGSKVAEDDPLVNLPFAGVSLLTLLAHTLYENKAITLSDLARFRCLLQKSINWEPVLSQAEDRGWLDGFCFSLLLYDHLEQEVFGSGRVPPHIANRAAQFLEGGMAARYLSLIKAMDRVHMPFRVSFLLSRILYWRKVIKDARRTRGERLQDLLATTLWGLRLKLHIHSQTSMLIAISGVDGAGKSSQSQLLTKAFRQCGIRSVYVWSRCASTALARFSLGRGRRLFTPRRIAGRGQRNQIEKMEARKRYLENPVLRSLWSAFVLTELTTLYNLKVRLPLLFGRTVVCDRYILDALVEPGIYFNDGQIARSPFAKLLMFLNPTPDLAWLIDVPPETVVRRKGEELLDHIRAETVLYRKLGEQLGTRVIDGDRAIVEVSDEILHSTLTKYYDRFQTFLRGVLWSNPAQLNP